MVDHPWLWHGVLTSKYDSWSDLDEYSQEEDDCGGFSDATDIYFILKF